MDNDLEPMDPRDAFELWMRRQEGRKADETLQSYRYRVKKFVEWLEEQGFDNLNELTGRDIILYDAERQDANVQQNTLNNEYGTIRLYLKFCADIDAVDENLPSTVRPPTLSSSDRVNTEKLPQERAERILDNLSQFRYASRDHVMILLLWRTTARLGAIRALDLEDVYLDKDDLDRLRVQEDVDDEGVFGEILEDVSVPFVYFRHRPDQDTPLKNGYAGERPVNLKPWVGNILGDYIRVNRVDRTEESGRRPLLTTDQGKYARISKSGIRNRIYRLTQPCRFGGDCPHEREIESCDARGAGYESQCPSSRSPHRIRTGSITWHRDRGWPPEVLSEKANTSTEMIKRVYDQPERLKRMQSRRAFLDQLDDNEINQQ